MRLLAALAAAGLVLSGPARADACLGPETMMAARLHEFSTIMLTVALRCRAINIDLNSSYEAMLRNHAPAFNASVHQLREHFSKSQHGFDAYATRLGNLYGGGATDPTNCHRFETVSNELAAAPELGTLARVAIAMVPEPHVDGITCDKP